MTIRVFAYFFLVLGLAAQTASELLQKAIYAQETLGDVAAAEKLYRQIIASSKDARPYAAQAQYRLGLCLLQKGDTQQARKAFEQLIADYPEQKDLVAQAREKIPAELKLLPTPWEDGEVLELQIKLRTGRNVGVMVLSVQSSGAAWILENRQYTLSPAGSSRVEVERDSLRPLRSKFWNAVLGEQQAEYQGRHIRAQVKGAQPQTYDVERVVFDNEQWFYLIRSMPLSLGYKYTLRILSPLGGGVLGVPVEVTAIEDVETPAGKFRAYKMEATLGSTRLKQIFWIACDGPRYPVKFESGPATGELRKVGRAGGAPVGFRDPKHNVSVTAPAGWIIEPDEPESQTETLVALLDPELKAEVRLWTMPVEAADTAPQVAFRRGAEAKITKRSRDLEKYKVREDSWTPGQIAGRPSLTILADFRQRDRDMVDSTTWVRGEKAWAMISAFVERVDLEAFRKRLDRIVSSLRIEQ